MRRGAAGLGEAAAPRGGGLGLVQGRGRGAGPLRQPQPIGIGVIDLLQLEVGVDGELQRLWSGRAGACRTLILVCLVSKGVEGVQVRHSRKG